MTRRSKSLYFLFDKQKRIRIQSLIYKIFYYPFLVNAALLLFAIFAARRIKYLMNFEEVNFTGTFEENNLSNRF